MYLPEAFQKKMKAILGEEYDDFLAGFEKPRHYGLRVNTAKITVEEFKELVPFHLTQIPWVENGFYYEEEDAPTRHPYYYAGLYYIQEPSAMTTASRLPVGPGERVLDLCAAPGGKATELGAKLFGEGLLVANDISASRVKALLKNIEVMGIPNSFLLNEVPAKIAEQFPAYFDKILVDAPCSGEGMFRKNPEAARVWSEEKPPECAKMQREIVKQAISMLKQGGMMIYSTCTFSPEENEQIIAWVLREFPEMQLIPMKGYEGFSEGRPDLADGNPELKKCVRIWPHHMDGEGHFVALMQKSRTPEMDDVSPEKSSAYISEADEEPSDHDDVKKKKKKAKKGRKDQKERNETAGCTRQERAVLESFFADVKAEVDWKRIEVRKGFAYYLPEGVEGKKNLVFVRNGLYLGEIRKDRFEPSQAFAMVLQKKEFASSIDFPAKDERVIRYLKGETVDMPTFNFKKGVREYNGEKLTLGVGDVLVIEGIHCLNDEFSHSLPKESKYKIYISCLTTLNIDDHNRIPTTDARLLRRIERDARTRGYGAQATIKMWPSVRRGEEQNIFPYQDSADTVFNSSLIYETALLKPYVQPLLFGVPRGSDEYLEAKRLLKFLDYFLPVPADDVPQTSLMREFVGGGLYKT